MKKKSILALSLVAALGAIMVVGGSLAWFSDTDEATNTFTVGSVEIEQVEDFVQDSQLIPVVAEPDHADPDTMTAENNYIKKEVSVKNTGKNPAYVQTFIAVPAALDLNDGPLHLHLGNNSDWTALGKVGDNVAITFDHDSDSLTADATQNFNVYAYRYNTELDVAGETSDVLSGVYIDAMTDLQVNRNATDPTVIDSAYLLWDTDGDGDKDALDAFNLADGTNMKLHVLVATQAIQSQGFENAAAAFNSGAFPAHPWA